MKTAERLAELEALHRPLTADECREANKLRFYQRRNEQQQRRYREDPEYRQRQRAKAARQRQAMGVTG